MRQPRRCGAPYLVAGLKGGLGRAGAIGCAVAFGLADGLCLVSGLRKCERLADPDEHGAVVACLPVPLCGSGSQSAVRFCCGGAGAW